MGNLSKLHIHIVGSVKGGSGKSTFSAKLCYSLNDNEKKACVIDLDLLGTSWFHLYRNAIADINYANDKKMVFLNDLVKDFEYYRNTLYMHELKFVRSTGKKENNIPVVFCDPSPKAKKKYKITDRANTADVSFSFFGNVVFKLLAELEDKQYTDVIIDMPPSSDPYAELVLNSCLETNKKFKTSLYMVSNLNLAHIKSTFEWYTDLMDESSSLHIITPYEKLKNKWDEDFSAVPLSPDKTDSDTDDTDEEKKILDENRKKKSEWLDTIDTCFFFVFNDTTQRENHFSKTICKSLVSFGGEKTNMLAYYFVGFDSEYNKHTDVTFSKGSEQIVFGNLFDYRDFKIL